MNESAHPLPHDDVHRLLTGMYDDYLRGDSAAIDALLAEDVTIFDSASEPLVTGLEELATLRGRRRGAAEDQSAPAWTETSLTIEDLRVRAVGGVLVATWWLRVDGIDEHGAAISPELSRNTAVLLRQADDSLRIAHLHEDVRQEAHPVV
ncbi:YybH family protein [Microbacterium sp. 2MCAF23]|uniref:YybH family protein n=1 Tax=Microbacterium sp. 2MCAF23 TaxID=3232985 RepID=UPI003F976143